MFGEPCFQKDEETEWTVAGMALEDVQAERRGAQETGCGVHFLRDSTVAVGWTLCMLRATSEEDFGMADFQVVDGAPIWNSNKEPIRHSKPTFLTRGRSFMRVRSRSHWWWCTEQREAWMNQIREVQMWRQVRGPAAAVMCGTRELGIKWTQWHTMIFEGETRIEICLPKRREENARATGQICLLEEVGNEARTRRIEGGYLAGAGSSLAAKENEGRMD